MGLFDITDSEKAEIEKDIALDAVKQVAEKIAPKDGKVHAFAFNLHWEYRKSKNMQIAEAETHEFERVLAAIQSYEREIVDVKFTSVQYLEHYYHSGNHVVVLYR